MKRVLDFLQRFKFPLLILAALRIRGGNLLLDRELTSTEGCGIMMDGSKMQER